MGRYMKGGQQVGSRIGGFYGKINGPIKCKAVHGKKNSVYGDWRGSVVMSYALNDGYMLLIFFFFEKYNYGNFGVNTIIQTTLYDNLESKNFHPWVALISV